MPTVYNWQIGREMEYRYEVERPVRQFSAVFDLNKCIACQTCTMACKTTWTSGRGQEYMFWNNVETKPYGGYPFAWDFKVLQMIGGGKWEGNKYIGKTIFEKAQEEGKNVAGFLPSQMDFAYPNNGEDEVFAKEPFDKGAYIAAAEHPIWFHYLPRICNHCTYPGCAANCPRQSIYKRKEDGIVLIDQSRCHGYKECVVGCPYKKSMFNSSTGRSEKCVGCYPKVEQGLTTQCMEQCIGKIRMQGWLAGPDKIDTDNPIDYMVHELGVALPMYPQFGTEANVYYIPPMNVPIPFLVQCFGPKAKRAVEIYRDELPKNKKLQALLLLNGSSPEIIAKFKATDTAVYGYNEKGKEVARVPLVEPKVVREHFDGKYNVYRTDIT